MSGAMNRGAFRYLLNFDVNKTILLVDPAAGKTLPQMLNSMLAERVYGVCDVEKKEWDPLPVKPDQMMALKAPPPLSEHSTDRKSDNVRVMSYARYLETVKYPSTQFKSYRRKMTNKFVETQLGSPYRHHFNSLLEHMQLNEQERKRLNETISSGKLDRLQVPGALLQGQRFILPSFFEFLRWVDRQEMHCALVLRTFGWDCVDVGLELDMFARGLHPSYPGEKMDGSQRKDGLNLRIPFSPAVEYPPLHPDEPLHPHTTTEPVEKKRKTHNIPRPREPLSKIAVSGNNGHIHPSGLTVHGSQNGSFYYNKDGEINLIRGSLHGMPIGLSTKRVQSYFSGLTKKHPHHSKVQSAVRSGLQLEKEDYPVEVFSGYKNIVKHLHALDTHRIYLFRDYYPWWKLHEEHPEAGKPFFIPQEQLEAYRSAISCEECTKDNSDTSGKVRSVRTETKEADTKATNASSTGDQGEDIDEHPLISVFFDDNIEHDDLHIVNPRSESGQYAPDVLRQWANCDQCRSRRVDLSMCGVHAWKAEPVEAVRDTRYYIRALQECEARVRKLQGSGSLLPVSGAENPQDEVEQVQS